MATVLPDAITHDHPHLTPVPLDPPLPTRTVALLRRERYESAAGRASARIVDDLFRSRGYAPQAGAWSCGRTVNQMVHLKDAAGLSRRTVEVGVMLESVHHEFVQREKVRFGSGREECAAWHYPGTNGACVVMAGGFAVTKEPGTDRFARRFQQAGFSALGFDYRRLGESGGSPRLVLGMRDQVADWLAAIAFARTLPGVDPDRIALWGFSASGGLVIEVAARCPDVAAVIAQSANVGGLAATRAPARYQKPGAMLRLLGRGLRDAVGGVFGREPLLVPLAGDPGTVALLSTPDGRVVPHPLDPDGRYPEWQREVAARSALTMPLHRPGRAAARVRCPLLAVVGDQDRTAPPEFAIAAAERAPQGEVVSVPGGHYAPFLDAHEQAVQAELAFLDRHLARSALSGGSLRAAGQTPAQ